MYDYLNNILYSFKVINSNFNIRGSNFTQVNNYIFKDYCGDFLYLDSIDILIIRHIIT
jgi:hypothetical protein